MQQKKIQFHYMREIITIPTKEDYLTYNLWWNEADYVEFMKSARKEILSLIQNVRGLNVDQALKIIYNPQFLSKEYEKEIEN